MKDHKDVSMIDHARFEFPIKERHDRTRIELAMTGCFHDLHFIYHSVALVNDESINALALITKVLAFLRIIGIWRRGRTLFELVVDGHDVGGAARGQDGEKQQR